MIVHPRRRAAAQGETAVIQSIHVLRSTRAQRRRLVFINAISALVLALAAQGCVRDEAALTSADAGTLPPGSPPPVDGTPPPGSPPPVDDTPPPVDPNPPIDSPPMTDVAAFEQTLYPVLRDPANFCVGCHGAVQIPTFAVDDVVTAYNVIISQQKVNLDNPEMSRVYLRPAVDRHNCGGDASCDVVASDVLAAIQDWVQQRPASDPSQQKLSSSKTSLAAGIASSAARADGNLIALFDFDEGAGDMTFDTSGVGAAMALQIEGMEWVQGGLKNISGKAQASLADSQKLFDMITAAGAFTIEAWLIPEDTAQDGPARIVSYSSSTTERNFMLGQNAIYYRFRNRSSASDANGEIGLESLTQDVTTELQHVVVTFDSGIGRKIYVNAQLSAEENAPATLDWSNDQIFVLGNEVTDNRVWKGVFQLVAIHSKALSAAEVQQNFTAGAGEFLTLQFDVSDILGNAARIDMLATQLDAAGYVFARPVFVSAATGIRVKNIRIAVNDSVPVAAQAFRRIDTTVLQPGTQLSPLGAVIPVAQSPEADQFHLEFEILGGRFGLAEAVAPSSPPAPLADVPEPALGMRSFSKVNDTMSAVTGIDIDSAAVSAVYSELRDSLPATDDLLSFGSSQQVAIQRLATVYCGELVDDGAACTDFFGGCSIAANGKAQLADTLYDKLIGASIANQPDRAGTTTELVSMMDDLGCTNGCTNATAATALAATCTAVLSSGALTIN
jgi:hypothetical protein